MILEREAIAHIEIFCDPVAWKAHGGYGRRSFNPLWRERDFYQSKIKEQYHGIVHLQPISIDYEFYRPIPKSTSKKKKGSMLSGYIRPSTRNDLDNLDKFLSDCLQGIVFEDDGQIVEKHSKKFYAETGKTVIRIWII